MDCILIALVIYEVQWDDADEDGEGGGGCLQMYVAIPQEPKNIPHIFFFKSIEIIIGARYFNL